MPGAAGTAARRSSDTARATVTRKDFRPCARTTARGKDEDVGHSRSRLSAATRSRVRLPPPPFSPSSSVPPLSLAADDFFTFFPLALFFGTSRSPTCSSCSRRVRRRYRRLYACTCTCTPPGVPPPLCRLPPFPRPRAARGASDERRQPAPRGERPPPRSAHAAKRRWWTTSDGRWGEGDGVATDTGNGERRTGRGAVARRERKAEFVASARGDRALRR